MSILKSEILNEAAELIEEYAEALREGAANPNTGEIENEDTLTEYRRHLFLGSRLRMYASSRRK